ncbi:hypothetical protein GCM10023210_16750 [Chryseobacterium ginsengisoli]|uniref:Uncharacterized protein n=1 Tax=Chryseobacterium ginsengisoli TaxID=363853 RepID=A0ABP9M996_9FLAO
MSLGLEIYFVFDVEEPQSEYSELIRYYDFDHRNGLNTVITGEDAIDVLDDEIRLLRQIEKVLQLDLTLLDFWKEYDKFIEIKSLRLKLLELEAELVKNPEFYQKIYGIHDIIKKYLKNNFLQDIRFLIERLNLNIENGASKVKYISN